MPPEAKPRPPATPEVGPRGDSEELDALRRAVGRAEGRGPGRLVATLLILALVGLLGAVGWGFATAWISVPRGPTSLLGPPAMSKAVLKPVPVAPVPSPTVVAPPVAGSAAGLEPGKPL
jgi:hypothetical protein